jgi:hypothetical protein
MQDYRGIKVPVTARDWQIYGSVPGSAGAARDLTKALKKAFNEFDRTLAGGGTVKGALANAARVIKPVMSKHGKYGATDTEPRYVAAQMIVNYAKVKVLGTLGETRYDWGDVVADIL